jgi:anaerobic ribonucleoside-triphosphate reductase activating protein
MMVNKYNDHGCRRIRSISLAGFLARSAVNGPGIRAVVWVQGCPFRCEGCFNLQFQPFSPAQTTDIGELGDRILSLPDIDGVTFSGGEPFAQAGPLALLGARLRNAGLDILTYSGYTYNQLLAGADPAWEELLSVSDLLVAGPYLKDRACPGRIAGSSNQQVIALTPRGRAIMPEKETGPAAGTMEFTISPDGAIITTGFPESRFVRKLALRSGGT